MPSASVTTVPGWIGTGSPGRSCCASWPGSVSSVPLVEFRSVTSTCHPSRVTRRWVREMSPSALGSLTTCGRSSPSGPAKSVRGLRPMTTPRSSAITSPSDSRSTPSTGRGTSTASCGSGAPHRRQAPPLGGFTCPLGQISAGTTGPMRSGGVVLATTSDEHGALDRGARFVRPAFSLRHARGRRPAWAGQPRRDVDQAALDGRPGGTCGPGAGLAPVNGAVGGAPPGRTASVRLRTRGRRRRVCRDA